MYCVCVKNMVFIQFPVQIIFLLILNISSDQNIINSVSPNLFGFVNNISFLYSSVQDRV